MWWNKREYPNGYSEYPFRYMFESILGYPSLFMALTNLTIAIFWDPGYQKSNRNYKLTQKSFEKLQQMWVDSLTKDQPEKIEKAK
jgi:hypothetical protein